MSVQTSRPAPGRLLRTLRRTTIDIEVLLAAIDLVVDAGPEPGVHVEVSQRSGHNPRIEVAEAERLTRATARALARDFEIARVPNDVADLAHAFTRWLDQRPVTDAAANLHGVAAMVWADDEEHRVRWGVVVARPSGNVVEWVPSIKVRPAAVYRAREKARARAWALPVDSLRAGEVTVWVHAPCPGLSTAILARPDELTAAAPGHELQVVFSPGRPVVCAELTAANRLTEETVDPHVLMSVADLDALGWN